MGGLRSPPRKIAMPFPRLFAIALVVAVGPIGGAAAVAAETDPAKAAPSGAKAAATAEIVFFPARGEANACGPGCNEWIAAEGKIDPGAAARLRRVLAKLGHRRVPIYFHSPGGSIAGSLELGRLIRDQKLPVSVGYTVPLACDRDKPLEKSCEAQKHSGQELESEFDLASTICNSGCVYAVAGGAVRLIPPWVKIGIHDVGFDPDNPPPRALMSEAKRIARGRIQQFLRDMGMDEALYKAAAAVPFETGKFLERDELVRFGIDRREFGEVGWQFTDEPERAIAKGFFVRAEGDQAHYVDGAVILTCGGGSAMRLALARQQGAAETPGGGPHFLGVNLNGQRIDLPYPISSTQLDMRAASLPASTFDAIGDDATIGLFGTGLARHDDPAGDVTLHMHGFSTAYARLRKSCDQPAQGPTAVMLPAGKPIPFADPGSLQGLSVPAVAGWPRAK
jgi:hypothetical protein